MTNITCRMFLMLKRYRIHYIFKYLRFICIPASLLENLNLLHVNNKHTDQPVHSRKILIFQLVFEADLAELILT